ncbi:hypothetical protein IJM86_04545 [bacterium]|nr:hypothetical protein [bacterium]
MDEEKLITVIEKNFKNGEKWKTYSKIKNSPAYAFITQAAIDILGKFDSELDRKLKSS